MDTHTPFWITTVAATPASNTTATAMTIVSDVGMPDVPFDAVIRRPGTYPTNTTATIVRITARTGTSITAMTRGVGGMALFPISIGDEVYQSMDGLFTQIRLGTATLAALQAAVDLYPGHVITWPENSPYTATSTSEVVALTPTHNGTTVIIPASSPWTPAAGSSAHTMFTVKGTVGASQTLGNSTRGSTVYAMADTTGVAAGDSVYIAQGAAGAATWYRSKVTGETANTNIKLATPICLASNSGNTLRVVTPAKNIKVVIYGDGTGNTHASTTLLETEYTEECEFEVHATSFTGFAHVAYADYKSDIDWDVESSGGAGEGGVRTHRGCTDTRIKCRSYKATGTNGIFITHTHYGQYDLLCTKAQARGIKFACSCGEGHVEVSGAGTYGLSFSDISHDLFLTGRSVYNGGFGVWAETSGGDYRIRSSFIGISRGNGGGIDGGASPGENDYYSGAADFGNKDVLLNADAAVSDNAGSLIRGVSGGYKGTTSVSVNNTTSETTLWTGTVRLGTLSYNSFIRLTIPFQLTNNSGADRTIRVRVYDGTAGTTAIFDDTTGNIATSASARAGELTVLWGNNGSLSAQGGSGRLVIGAPNGAGVGTGALDAANTIDAPFLMGTGVVDSASLDLILKVTVTLSNNDFNLTTTRQIGEIVHG